VSSVVVAALAMSLPVAALAQPRPAAPPASADRLPSDSPPTNEPKTKEQLEAQQHFQRAKELYASGAYREAIAELEQARTLDPKAKDLVFNLGIVHEKLGKFDEAVAFFREYLEMDTVTTSERAKAENIIKRVEGAKREVPVAASTGSNPSSTSPASDAPPAPQPTPEDEPRGRIDVATITVGSVALVGLGVGTAFGILALANKPNSGEFTTSRDGSYDTLKSKANDANTQAIVADVGFGVGIAAALVTAYLYFGRPRDPKPASVVRVLPSVAALPSGGVMMLGGSFR
jgi:tetratricopeptide (TPR) repeat protein